MQHRSDADNAPSNGAEEYLMEVGITSTGQAIVNGNRNYLVATIAMLSGVYREVEHPDSNPMEQRD